MASRLLKLSTQAALIVLIIGLAGLWPSWHWGAEAYVAAEAWAAAVCVVGMIVGLVPIALATSRKTDWLPQACLASTGTRLVVTLSIATAVYLIVRPPKVVFALWIMAFYLALLVWESIKMVQLVKECYQPSTDAGMSRTGAPKTKPPV
jgi:hypothetical protein